MKYLAITTTVVAALFTFSACSGDSTEEDGGAGETGSGGSTASGGGESGGSDSGGSGGQQSGGSTASGGMGGMGGAPSCNPEESMGGAAGAAGSAGASSIEGPAIMGEYVDNFFMGAYVVTSTRVYNEFANSFIQSYNDKKQYIVTLNDETNTYFPCLYSRFDWHYEGDDLYLCTSAYDAASVEDALAAPKADTSDLEAGCNGFPWTMLTPQ